MSVDDGFAFWLMVVSCVLSELSADCTIWLRVELIIPKVTPPPYPVIPIAIWLVLFIVSLLRCDCDNLLLRRAAARPGGLPDYFQSRRQSVAARLPDQILPARPPAGHRPAEVLHARAQRALDPWHRRGLSGVGCPHQCTRAGIGIACL